MDFYNTTNIGSRDSSRLLNESKNVRISCFNTPSSFYVQLVEEDDGYIVLETEMFDFYYIAPLYYYCKDTVKLKAKENDELVQKRLIINHLKPQTVIVTQVRGQWARCASLDYPNHCRMLDTGEIIHLSKTHEDLGIFEIEENFLTLPPRAILCGLGNIIPLSASGVKWTRIACALFRRGIEDRSLQASFINKALFPDSYYLFLSSIGNAGDVLHINTMLMAFTFVINFMYFPKVVNIIVN